MTTALVTGGTSGIGAAFARALAERGHDLVLVARDADRLASVAAELGDRYGVGVETLPADLAVRDDVLVVAARLADAERPVDVLVNNAGYGLHVKLLDDDLPAHERAIDVMCLAVLALGGAAGRAMRERGHGTIINVASLAAYISQGAYSPIKAWVLAYSEGLANELHGSGVTVTAVNPGWVRTEFHDRAGITTSSIPDFVWVEPDRVARETLADADKGRAISVPTKRWKLQKLLARHAPRSAVRLASRMLSRSRE
ncbi:SDR family NAD(P)-dependent oxidoreductase [Micropruina sonneratiae]|uniref:SDR family NAD(P)-dependent oxidoreductase n=1 Tax=Micropruina sonneratiae TaxID=2986940 RepID=UPI002226C3B7|nr:SDR family oxidoreductase [Micropruina sp. KQZ13P-5]MCW3159211.1 SDR family oxidoreductase [Micropruina sp. KQZ13P-5]